MSEGCHGTLRSKWSALVLLLPCLLLIACASKERGSGFSLPTEIHDFASVNPPEVAPTATTPQNIALEMATVPSVWPGNPSGELSDLREAILRTPFAVPIVGAPLPTQFSLLPGAARPYRRGIHQGIDFYFERDGKPVTTATPVVAAKIGTVIRADWDFVEHTQRQMDWLLDITRERGYTPEDVLDRLRGRQVWLDHGYGIVTRYAHLDRLAPEVVLGRVLQEGQVLGYNGNSGSPDAAAGLDTDVHLHFEIRVGDQYFGQGLKPQDIVPLLPQVFACPRPLGLPGGNP